MTDNRTNEPTPEQVEAALAAHAAHKGAWVDELFREMVCPECGWCYMTAHERRTDSEVSNEVVYARVDVHRMRAALVAAQGAAPQAESEYEHLLKARALHQTNAGLPSSGVDEGALAEVIDRAIVEWNRSIRVEDGITRSQFVARAVAEWLKGQGGGAQ